MPSEGKKEKRLLPIGFGSANNTVIHLQTICKGQCKNGQQMNQKE